jgi:putative two-component system response regulator
VRVLLVDDEPLQRLLLMRALEPLGVEVSEARNGREALDLFKEKPYHLVLTDLHMPLMDGLELTRAIKAQDGQVAIFVGFSSTAQSGSMSR